MRSIHSFVALTLLVSIVGSVGCARVKPWQRENLAQEGMQFNPDPHRSALNAHIEFSKEASMPASGAAGGGCGCN